VVVPGESDEDTKSTGLSSFPCCDLVTVKKEVGGCVGIVSILDDRLDSGVGNARDVSADVCGFDVALDVSDDRTSDDSCDEPEALGDINEASDWD
jgi:hypothetical protein